MKNRLKILLAPFLALLLGITLTSAFAPFDIFPFAFLAPAGLLLLWRNVSAKQALWLGFLFGVGFFGSGVYWVFHSIHVFGGVPTLPAAFITSLFIAILALFPATVGFLLNRYFPISNGTKFICAFPAIWTFSEWVRSWIFTGFPWLLLGYSQTHSPLSGYAPIISVYGVSLALLISSGLLVHAYFQYQQKNFRHTYLCLLGFITIWIAGGLLNLISWTKPQGRSISISLVQGNIPQELKWSPDHLQLSFDRYLSLTAPLWGKYDLIIWPEAAIPVPMQSARNFIYGLNQKAEMTNTALILGIPIKAKTDEGYYNAIVTLGKDKKVYLKRRLVPFGEYIPSTPLFTRLFDFMNIPMSNLIPGRGDQDPLIINGIKILPSICYEVAFPELMNTDDKSVGIILTVTNDAWFGKSSAQAQHLQMAEMRALELQRPIIFVSNDGITAMINSKGKIIASAPPHESYILSGSVQPTYGLTPWMKNGIDPVTVLIILLLFIAVKQKRSDTKVMQQHDERTILPERN